MLKRSFRAGLYCLALLAIPVAGCGSSSKSSSTTTTKHAAPIVLSKTPPASLPHATESLSAFEKRLTVAAHDAAAGKCGPATAFGKSSALNLSCKGAARKQLAGFKVTGGATYGTGAVVEFTDADVAGKTHLVGVKQVTPAHAGNAALYTLALSKSGRYVYLPAGPPPVFPGSYIGTKPSGWTGADSTAMTFLNAVRRSDCTAWFKNTLTPTGMSKTQACELGLAQAYAPLRKSLASGQPVKLSRMGGNGILYYYWLEIGNRAGTLAIGRQPPSPPYIALGTTEAPKP